MVACVTLCAYAFTRRLLPVCPVWEVTCAIACEMPEVFRDMENAESEREAGHSKKAAVYIAVYMR